MLLVILLLSVFALTGVVVNFFVSFVSSMDRASVYGTEGWEFESLTEHYSRVCENLDWNKKNF